MSALTGMFHEFCTLLARSMYDHGLGASDPKVRGRLIQLRRQLHQDMTDPKWIDVLAGADCIYRTMMQIGNAPFAEGILRENKAYLSELRTEQAGGLVGFSVLIVEDGEVRHRTDLSEVSDAVSMANRAYFLHAWPGSTVVLTGRIRNGRMVSLADKTVRAE